jgi:hypothetical protein
MAIIFQYFRQDRFQIIRRFYAVMKNNNTAFYDVFITLSKHFSGVTLASQSKVSTSHITILYPFEIS